MIDIRISEIIAPHFYDVHKAIKEKRFSEYVLSGGRGSAKSSFVAIEILLLLKRNPTMHALVCRQVKDTLKDSVFSQIEWAIEILGLGDEFKVTRSPLLIESSVTGQRIYFRGADDPFKIKSIKPPFGYIGILWFEELDTFAGEEQIRSIEQSVIRGGSDCFIFKTFNPPRTASNWANKYAKNKSEFMLVHNSTYWGVPSDWLGDAFIARAEFLQQTNEKVYNHEYLGMPISTGSIVFDNVEYRQITDAEIGRYNFAYNGLDFGWVDPFAFNRMYYNPNIRELYIYKEFHACRKRNKEIADIIIKDGTIGADFIICDSAEPKSIEDLRLMGLNARGAVKGAGSLERGMRWLQSLNKITIDPRRCPETKKEFEEYEYFVTKNGEITSQYVDANDHHISAVRYAMEQVWNMRGE